MAFGVFEATPLVERARKLVNALEAGDGRSAFSDAGYGEGDHAQGQRLLRNAEEALAEAQKPPTTALKLRQMGRAYQGWLETRTEELKREGLRTLAPKMTARHAMELVGRLRQVARGNVANERLDGAATELKEWLDRWTPVAKRIAAEKPDLAARLGVMAPGKKAAAEKQANA